jgi:sulfur-carrier protein
MASGRFFFDPRLAPSAPAHRIAFPDCAHVDRMHAAMTVTVLLFASYADALGANSLNLEIAPGATVRDLLGQIHAFPGAARLPRTPLIAVNEVYARLDRVLDAGDEVAVIPPVAGG